METNCTRLHQNYLKDNVPGVFFVKTYKSVLILHHDSLLQYRGKRKRAGFILITHYYLKKITESQLFSRH